MKQTHFMNNFIIKKSLISEDARFPPKCTRRIAHISVCADGTSALFPSVTDLQIPFGTFFIVKDGESTSLTIR